MQDSRMRLYYRGSDPTALPVNLAEYESREDNRILSPRVRRVVTHAFELGIERSIDFVSVGPRLDDNQEPRENPLGQVPTLVTEDGVALCDSLLISLYFESKFGPCLIASSGPERWAVLNQHALAEGVLMSLVWCLVLDTPDRIPAKYGPKIHRGLDALNRVPVVTAGFDLSQITVATTIAWLETWGWPWRTNRAQLSQWYDSVSVRDSLQRTKWDALVSRRTSEHDAVLARAVART